jgi:hypothetical protein
MKQVHHVTKTDEVCKICGKPFDFFWFNEKETNGQSETMWGNGYHKFCLENKTGKKCRTLHEINKFRKYETY